MADQNATVLGAERPPAAPGSCQLSLVVPVYNERDALPGLLDEMEQVCVQLGVDWEIVVVDDGSTDGTAELLDRYASGRSGVSVVRLRRNFGKSAALTAGFDHSFGEIVVTLDGDGQDDPAEIPAMIRKLDEGYDLVSGWKRRRRDPALKRWSSHLFNWVTGHLSGQRLHDFNCGLKAYRGRCARSLDVYGELHRYIPVLAAQRGWRVTEVAVEHRPRVHGQSKFGAARYPRGLFDLMTVLFIGRYRQRPLHLFGGIGMFLIVAGGAISAYLAILWLSGQAIGQRPLLLLGALLIVVGAQFLTFGLLGQLMTAIGHDSGRPRADGYEVEQVVEPGGLSGDLVGGVNRAAEGAPTPSVPQRP